MHTFDENLPRLDPPRRTKSASVFDLGGGNKSAGKYGRDQFY